MSKCLHPSILSLGLKNFLLVAFGWKNLGEGFQIHDNKIIQLVWMEAIQILTIHFLVIFSRLKSLTQIIPSNQILQSKYTLISF